MQPQYSIYRAYGLILRSEFPLPELETAEGDADVLIRFGQVPEFLDDATARGPHYDASAKAFLLRIDGVARYYVREGKEIVIDPYQNIQLDKILLFLLGSVFAVLLHQRQTLVLHGSAINVHGNGILFTGASGSGKSTLAAAFHQRGYPILTDDVCAVQAPANEAPLITPGFPRLKLWSDAAEKLGVDTGSLPKIRENLAKYGLVVETLFEKKPITLSRVYILSPQDQDGIPINSLDGTNKLSALIQNTYRLRFLEGQGGKSLHFKQCVEVAKAVKVYQVARPKSFFCLDQLVSFLETEFIEFSKR